jgi:endonuclease YncB( thermonuclease family)
MRSFVGCSRPRQSSVWRFRPLGLMTLLTLTGLAPMVADTPALAEGRAWGTVSAVISSTQLTVILPDQGRIQVRLLGVDPPEPPQTNAAGVAVEGQPFGQQATDYVRELLLEKQVQLDTYGKDRAGRLLSVVWLGEININLTLVKEGFAWVAPSLTVTNVRAELEVAERQARVAKYGLWALPEPEPPWAYRKRYRLAPE